MVIQITPMNSSNVSDSLSSSFSSQNTVFRTFKLFLYAVIFMVSVTGNALVCIIIVRHRRMRTVTNYFTLNLAVADLAVTCICIPFDIPVQENDYRRPYGGFLCRTLYPLQTMAMFASIFTLTAASLNRFCAIVYPFKTHMRQMFDRYFLLFCCLSLWHDLLRRISTSNYSILRWFPHNIRAIMAKIGKN